MDSIKNVRIQKYCYYWLSLKCKIFAIWLVETGCIFPTFLITTVKILMEFETQ